jgi:menaquinone-dependent protoporphyrinogen IX oxidase
LRFLRNNRVVLKRIPVAVFVTCMSLTRSGETSVTGLPIYVDEQLPKPPETAGHLSFRERYAQLANYVRPILSASGAVKPVSIAVIGGRLDYGRMKWWAVLFAMLIIQAPAGDRRNWTAIRSWAAELPAAFQFEMPLAEGLAQVA